MVAEVRKCILVCANCHREIHAGLLEQDDLSQKQVFNEDIVEKYTTEVEQARASTRIKKGEIRRRIKDEQQEWIKLHSHTSSTPRKVDWSKHDVYQLLEEHKSYEAVGRLLGVTGAAVKRRLKHLESKK